MLWAGALSLLKFLIVVVGILLAIGLLLAAITWRALIRHLREYPPQDEGADEHPDCRENLTVIVNRHHGVAQ